MDRGYRKEIFLKTIRNKAHRPIAVPLPLGKKLRLGPNQTGEIADRAEEHPPLKKLLEAGDLEIVHEGSGGTKHRPGGGTVHVTNQGHHASVTPRNSGDR